MKNKKTLIILILVFALLIGGASVLYNRLSEDQAPGQLVVLPTRPNNQPTQPTKPATQPTDPATQPTDPATQPTDPATQPTDPATQPTDPATQPTDPATQPTEPPTQPTEPPTQPTEPPTQPPQPTAPDFVVYDAAGNPVRLSDYFGKPIVLNFWASWCGPCRSEMPHFQEMYEKWGDEVVFLMVNMTDGSRETIATASSFIGKGGYTFPVFFDLHYDAATAYSVYYLPTTYFLDAQGNVVTYAISSLSAEALQQYIDLIR